MFRASNNHAFTIVELVVVIIILGIISAVAAPRFFDLQGYKQIAFKDELVSALRYAQKRAVASGEIIEVNISVTGFSLQYADGTPVKHPGGGNFTSSEEASIPLTAQTIIFDALGRARDTDFNTTDFPDVAGLGVYIHGETGCVEVN